MGLSEAPFLRNVPPFVDRIFQMRTPNLTIIKGAQAKAVSLKRSLMTPGEHAEYCAAIVAAG